MPRATRQVNPPFDHNDSIEKLAWYMDEAFQIPGTRYRVGWDAIIGLIPGVGETVMLLSQCGLILMAVQRHDVPPIIAARMAMNVAIDSFFGSIPLIGDLFDAFFKANTRNVKLLREVRSQQTARGRVSKARHYAYFGVIAAILLLIAAGALTLTYIILRALIEMLQINL